VATVAVAPAAVQVLAWGVVSQAANVLLELVAVAWSAAVLCREVEVAVVYGWCRCGAYRSCSCWQPSWSSSLMARLGLVLRWHQGKALLLVATTAFAGLYTLVLLLPLPLTPMLMLCATCAIRDLRNTCLRLPLSYRS